MKTEDHDQDERPLNPASLPSQEQDLERQSWAQEQAAQLHAEIEERVERETTELRAEWRRERLIAETLQRSLLLAMALPYLHLVEEWPGLNVEVASEVSQPEVLIGGDFADVLPLGGGVIALVNGDTCGNGLAAALGIPQTLYALRLILSEHPHPARALGRLNRYLCGADLSTACPSVALSLAVVDTRTGETVCACAGSEPPLILRAGGVAESVSAGSVALGVNARQTYRSERFVLREGDALLLATDGITEARRTGAGARLEFLGYEGLVGLALDAWGAERSPGQVVQSVLSGAKAFAGGRLHDDACVLLAKKMITTL